MKTPSDSSKGTDKKQKPQTEGQELLEANIVELSAITTVANVLYDCFEKLGYKEISKLKCESIAYFINLTMATRNRVFHEIKHALAVAEVEDPIGKIAALFHDIVYINIDRSRLPELRKRFGVFDPGENLFLKIPSKEILQRDVWRRAITALFGFIPGKEVQTNGGINEFLSSWVCIDLLKEHISDWDLLKIIACIEATIPFRGVDSEGRGPSEALLNRLPVAAKILNLKRKQEDFVNVVRVAVSVANQDVVGFSAQGPVDFVDSAWALLYESNPPFQSPFFSISQYRMALQKLEEFFSFLKPEVVFRTFFGYPDVKTYTQLIIGAKRNLQVAQEYVQAKLLETTVIEAVAQLTGGDAPLEMFNGRKGTADKERALGIKKFLEESIEQVDESNFNADVVKLLEPGLFNQSKFNFRDSPIGLFLLTRLTKEEFQENIKCAQEFIKGQLGSLEYLKCYRKELMHTILQALAAIVWTRHKAILDIYQNVSQNTSQPIAQDTLPEDKPKKAA